MRKDKIQKIQDTLLSWYARNGRDLPWRQTDNLYKITVSEIMLQQTNVPKVIQKYKEFLLRFPDVEILARARQATVVNMWQGLGYNRRALNLHKLAKMIVSEYGGVFPETPEELEALPGIGPYTKNAVLAFGRNRDVSAVDVNIERFVRRVHGYPAWPEGADAHNIIEKFVPSGRARDWHNSVMDIASIFCTKKKPNCEQCPIQKYCLSYPEPKEPVVAKKKEKGRTEGTRHIPRRIYRGRIVECLRKEKLSSESIGVKIKSDWSNSDEKWLADILHRLSEEGMIKHRNNIWQLK